MISGICSYCKKSFRKREQKYKFCSPSCSSRFNLNGLKVILLPILCNELAEFIGICLGDGYVSQYQACITLNSNADIEYVPYVAGLAKKLFPEATISLIKRKDNAIDIRINSRIVADFLKSNGIIANAKYIPPWIIENFIYSRYCMKGLFDTEGSISFKKYLSKKGTMIYKQLNFRNTDVNLMAFVRDNLISLGLKPTLTLKKSLYLSNDKSISIFRDLVGFGNPKLLERSLICDINTYYKFKKLKIS
ncbi:MAG TPA: hypothetical protein VLG67_03630 [Candidatus Saccharimonadales bacterium]|nr:hypothetical protein [Candidatus Saccharimonadales bacterium]